MQQAKRMQEKPAKLARGLSSHLLLVIALLCPFTATAQRIMGIRALDVWSMPPHPYLDRLPVGGITDLSYAPTQAQFYAISYDPSHQTPPRFYTLHLQLNSDGKLTRHGIAFTKMTALQTAASHSKSAATWVPRGIATAMVTNTPQIFIGTAAVQPSTFYHPPVINSYSLAGTLAQELPLPAAVDTQHQNPHTQLSLANLATSPDSHWLFTANTLIKGESSAVTAPDGKVWLIRYDLTAHHATHRWVYPISPATTTTTDTANQLVALAALDNSGRNLLTLERRYQSTSGYHIRLYEVDIQATPQHEDPASLLEPVRKTLIMELSNANTRYLGNIEGLALGPLLDSGEQLLVLVSNNQFSARQRTVFYTFAIRYPEPAHS